MSRREKYEWICVRTIDNVKTSLHLALCEKLLRFIIFKRECDMWDVKIISYSRLGFTPFWSLRQKLFSSLFITRREHRKPANLFLLPPIYIQPRLLSYICKKWALKRQIYFWHNLSGRVSMFYIIAKRYGDACKIPSGWDLREQKMFS